MITDIEDFFTKGCGRCERFATPDCSIWQWIEGLRALRRICREAGLIETVKWGHPCYMGGNRNIAILGAFRGDFRLTFFNAALMKDPAKVLVRQGPNTRHPDMIRFTDNAQVQVMEQTLLSYLKEAISYAEAGILPPKEAGQMELPQELAEALGLKRRVVQYYEKGERGGATNEPRNPGQASTHRDLQVRPPCGKRCAPEAR